MDSFRPGSSSYCPFQSKTDANNNPICIEDSDPNEDVTERAFNFLRPSEITQRGGEDANSSILLDLENAQTTPHVTSTPEPHDESRNLNSNGNTHSEVISAEEENRRRLYLNFGRPRPFYRVSSTPETSVQEKTTQTGNANKKRIVQSLQEEARNQIVAKYGLNTLSNMFKNAEVSPKLPPLIKNFLFTFPCQAFEVYREIQ